MAAIRHISVIVKHVPQRRTRPTCRPCVALPGNGFTPIPATGSLVGRPAALGTELPFDSPGLLNDLAWPTPMSSGEQHSTIPH